MTEASAQPGPARERGEPIEESCSPVERLLRRSPLYGTRRLGRRELRVEAFSAALLLLLAGAMAIVVPSERELEPLLALALVGAHAVASRIPLQVGAGAAVPTQVVLVPMLFLLPAPAVPALVACSSVIAAALDVAREGKHPDRLVVGVGDAWHAVGSSAVFVLAGEPAPIVAAWSVLVGALAIQFLVDLLAATAREWLGRAIAPGLQVRVIASVQAIDVCLTPVGMLAALASAEWRLSFLLVLPLLPMLAALASDRRVRIEEVGNRLDELRAERTRVDAALLRIGEALASTLDRDALAELTLRTVVEAVDAAGGRMELASGAVRVGTTAPELEPLFAAAVEQARAMPGECVATSDEHGFALGFAFSHDLEPARSDVLVVARPQLAFSTDARVVVTHLANQARVAMENVALHDRLRRQALEDELTGLANHRRFQEVIRRETDRSRRSERPLTLAMFDVDDFKAVNDRHGHQQGDVVLRAVARAIAGSARITDETARYGGEELAVVLPETDLAGGLVAAEKMRRAVEALQISAPDGSPLPVTVSVGVSELRPGEGDAESLVAAADAALYEAKRRGKNRTAAATPARRFTAANGDGERASRFSDARTS